MTSSAELDVDAAAQMLSRQLNRINTIQEVPMRRALAREWLEQAPVDQLCWALGELLRGAMRGHTQHDNTLFAVCLALIEAQHLQDYPLFQNLFAGAHAQQRQELLFLFRDSPPERVLPEGSRLPEAHLPMDREVSLGERRSLAAGSNRRFLERLLLDPNPMVISKLLSNPAIQVRDILIVASRRPTLPELLETILADARWLQHHDVRESLARNPFIQTGYALKLLPTLKVQVLRQVRDASEVHRGVREFAELLVRLYEWQIPSSE